MLETETKISYQINNEGREKLPVIIVAAGSSSRMGKDKQLIEISGIPVIVRTMLAFERCDLISRIVLVTKAEDIFNLQNIGTKYGISKLTDIVCGGGCRAESVLKGFDRISESEKKVLIHDGARPLITERVIANVAEGLKEHKAVTCAVKVKDTIMQVDSSGMVVTALERDSLVAVQTPQGVSKDEYLEAINSAEDISVFTDDMSVMKSAGFSVYTVDGDYKNIKLTTLDDIAAAESYLKEEMI